MSGPSVRGSPPEDDPYREEGAEREGRRLLRFVGIGFVTGIAVLVLAIWLDWT